ncbi:MAG: NAD(P)H-hydrate epimerase [Lacipirellulaceae bacterium]
MNALPSLTREQSRRVDQIAIDEYGFSGLVLMENAGRGVADVLLGHEIETGDSQPSEVVILCGKGNNAGDGFVLARHLEIRGVRSKVLLLASPDELRGDALANYRVLQNCESPIVDLSAVGDLPASLDEHVGQATWLVDAMLGTGAQGTPRSPYDSTIRWMNNQHTRKLALDLPSGLDCDTGEAADPTVRADLTCTFATSKIGFDRPGAREHLGTVRVISIGIPSGAIERATKT